MAEHYTSNTESVWEWCEHCQAFTEHTVSDHRKGPCVNSHARTKPADKPKPAKETDTLFPLD